MPYDGSEYVPNEAVRVLDKMAVLLDRPEKWCKHMLWSDFGEIRAYCIGGAASFAVFGDATAFRRGKSNEMLSMKAVIAALGRALPPQKDCGNCKIIPGWFQLIHYNNLSETKHADILKLIADARADLVAKAVRATVDAV